MNTHVIEPDVIEPRTGVQMASHAEASHPLRKLGPKYAPHDASAPIFEPIDMAGLAAAIVITLGPLAAYAVGMGA